MAGEELLAAGLIRFVCRFDAGEYWLAHEELEELWLSDRRDVYKGLIHLAAACLHLERGNHAGAGTKFGSARHHISNDAAALPDLDTDRLLAAIAEVADNLPAETEAPRSLRLQDFIQLGQGAPTVEPVELPYRVQRHGQGYRPGRDPHRRD